MATQTTPKDIRDRRIGDREAQRREGSVDPKLPAALAALPDLASRVHEREEDAADLRQSLLAEKTIRDERIRRALAAGTERMEEGAGVLGITRCGAAAGRTVGRIRSVWRVCWRMAVWRTVCCRT